MLYHDFLDQWQKRILSSSDEFIEMIGPVEIKLSNIEQINITEIIDPPIKWCNIFIDIFDRLDVYDSCYRISIVGDYMCKQELDVMFKKFTVLDYLEINYSKFYGLKFENLPRSIRHLDIRDHLTNFDIDKISHLENLQTLIINVRYLGLVKIPPILNNLHTLIICGADNSCKNNIFFEKIKDNFQLHIYFQS